MTQFDDFFLKEYERISEAHFSTQASISQFMRHYIAVASVPLALVVLLAEPGGANGIMGYLRLHPATAMVPLLGVSAVGFFLSIYVMRLVAGGTAA